MNWLRCADSSEDEVLDPPLLLVLLLLLAAMPVLLELKSASYKGSFLPTIMNTGMAIAVALFPQRR